MLPSVSIFSICLRRPSERLTVWKLVNVPPSQRSVTYIWPQALADSLIASCACFLVPTNRTLSAFGDGLGREIAGRFQLRQRLAQVDDVNAVAGIEDELLHLGVPTFGLVSEMNTCFQQFFNSDDLSHISFVKVRAYARPSRGTRD